MRKRLTRTLAAAAVATLVAVPAGAEELRIHTTAGAARAFGGTQEREFGMGGGGSAGVELPVSRALGVQVTGGAVVLSKGEDPADPTLRPSATGTAMLGTAGVRLRPLGAVMVAGPWIDANAGVARTGDATRPVVSGNLGWDFRIGSDSRLDIGPFVGFAQVVQQNAALRPDDARILMAGVSVSLGARSAPPPPTNPLEPAPSAEPQPLADRDGDAGITNECPREAPLDDEGCRVGGVRIVEDRIQLDDTIHFEFDSARIRSRSYGLLQKLARVINEHPEITYVSIEGHADAVGTNEYNQQLSEARAVSTRRLLVRYGVPESRLVVVAHGKSRLRVRSALPTAENRRVEFHVKRKNATASAGTAGVRGRP